jgi:hypothetical protein
MPAPARFAFALLLLAAPIVVHAQGTAPGQGVTRPIPQGTPPAQPPAPRPGTLSDGRPKADAGGGAADTAPGTTSSLPLPQPGQANPPDKQ